MAANKISYYIKLAANMSYKGLFDCVSYVHNRSGKNRVGLFFDIIWCGLRYGAGYSDYKLFEFEKLSPKQRKTYVTRSINNKIVRMLNNKDYIGVFADKKLFNEKFAEFVKRDSIDISQCGFEEFDNFLNGKSAIMAKRKDGCCGKGMEKVNVAEIADKKALYEELKRKSETLIEDYVIQHDSISKIYPYSVNTLRIVTVKGNVVAAFVRFGNNGNNVDNLNSGGMSAPVSIDTGEIFAPAYDKNENVYKKHPMTGEKILGFKIPMWDEAKQLCKRASAVIPQVGYVGWDVSVTNNGPLLIEGNEYPGHDILQLPVHLKDGIGLLPTVKKYL